MPINLGMGGRKDSKVFAFRLSSETQEKLAEISTRMEKEKSVLVREALEAYLNNCNSEGDK